jgi:lysophospholipase L1-like esterase
MFDPVRAGEGGQNQYNSQDDVEYLNNIISSYTRNVLKMNSFCQSRNIQFIVALQPEIGQKIFLTHHEKKVISSWSFGRKNYDEYFPEVYREFRERSKKILEENNVTVIDINDFTEFNTNQNTLFSDVVHPNKEGNKIIAEILNAKINEILN